MEVPISNLKGVCREKGIVLTAQRHCVFETLFSMKGHPDIGEIYREVEKKMPSISMNTVYSALSWLEANGLARTAPSAGTAKRFDTVLTAHHHLQCVKCGSLEDFKGGLKTNDIIPDKFLRNNSVIGFEVVIKIICDNCKRD